MPKISQQVSGKIKTRPQFSDLCLLPYEVFVYNLVFRHVYATISNTIIKITKYMQYRDSVNTINMNSLILEADSAKLLI